MTDVKFFHRCESHHAAIEVLLHFTEGVWRYLSFAWNNDADVSHCQSSMWLALWCSAIRNIDPLGRVAADVGGTSWRRGLYEVTTLFQTLLPLIQNSERQRKKLQLDTTFLYFLSFNQNTKKFTYFWLITHEVKHFKSFLMVVAHESVPKFKNITEDETHLWTQNLVKVPFVEITTYMDMKVISLWTCWDAMEAQVDIIVTFSYCWLVGLVSLIFLTKPHRFSLGFRSVEFGWTINSSVPWWLLRCSDFRLSPHFMKLHHVLESSVLGNLLQAVAIRAICPPFPFQLSTNVFGSRHWTSIPFSCDLLRLILIKS